MVNISETTYAQSNSLKRFPSTEIVTLKTGDISVQ